MATKDAKKARGKPAAATGDAVDDANESASSGTEDQLDMIDAALDEYAERLALRNTVDKAESAVLRDGGMLSRIALGLARAVRPQKRGDDEAKSSRNVTSERVRRLVRARVQLAQKYGATLAQIALVELQYGLDRDEHGDAAAYQILAAGATFGTFEQRMNAVKAGADMQEAIAKLSRTADTKPRSRKKGSGGKSRRKDAATGAPAAAASTGASQAAPNNGNKGNARQ